MSALTGRKIKHMLGIPESVTASTWTTLFSQEITGLTPGVVTASKAVIVDANKDIGTFRHLTLSGNLVTGSTTLSEAELGVLDGVTPGTVTASKALVVSAGSALNALTITTLSSTTSNQTTNNVGADAVAGTLNIFPTTTAKGKLAVTVTDQTGNTTVGLVIGAMAAARTITLADPGATANIVTSVGVGSTQVTRCTAQLDKTDATLTNITGLSQTVQAGTYQFEYWLPTTCGGTGGTKTAFKYTTTALSAINYSSLGYTASAVAVANGTTTTDQATHIASNTAAIGVHVMGTMVVSTGGTIDLQFAENSVNSTSSVLVGAYMKFTRIA